MDRLSEIHRRSAEMHFLDPDDGLEEDENAKCEACKEYPEDNYLYFFNGKWMCKDCVLASLDRRDTIMESI